MLWYIAGILLFGVLLAGAIVLCAPARLRCDCCTGPEPLRAQVFFSWPCRAILRLHWDSGDAGHLRAGVLFWNRVIRLEDSSLPSRPDATETQPDSKATAKQRDPPAESSRAQQTHTADTQQPALPRQPGASAGIRTPSPRTALGTIRFVLRQRSLLYGLLRSAWATARALLRLLRIERFSIHITGATREPWLSGVLAGCCSALNGALESRPADRLHLSYEPQFDRDILVADIRFEVRSSGARLAWPAVVLLLTFPYFGAWRCWRAWRREARADT